MSTAPINTCANPNCRVHLSGTHAATHAKKVCYEVWKPYPATCTLWRVTCHHCTAVNCVADAPFHINGHPQWIEWSQRLTDEDYDRVMCDRHMTQVDGEHGVAVCWPWTPLSGVWQTLVRSMVAQDDRWRDPNLAHVLILPPHYDPKEWIDDIGVLFGSVYRLRPHVMFDAVGPYSSLRTELSIITTYADQNLHRVDYFWPTFRIPNGTGGVYHPMARDHDLMLAWAAQSRVAMDVRRLINETEKS